MFSRPEMYVEACVSWYHCCPPLLNKCVCDLKKRMKNNYANANTLKRQPISVKCFWFKT